MAYLENKVMVPQPVHVQAHGFRSSHPCSLNYVWPGSRSSSKGGEALWKVLETVPKASDLNDSQVDC